MRKEERYRRALFFLTLILVIAGLFSLISASAVIGAQEYGDVYYFVKRQIILGIFLGTALAWIASKINYRFWKKVIVALILINIILIGLCFFEPFRVGDGSVRRWLRIGPITFQPSEFLKIFYIVFLSSILSNYSFERRRKFFDKPFLFYLISFGIIALFLVVQPSTGTLVILALSALTVYFAAGLSFTQLISLCLIGAIFFSYIIMVTPYRLERIYSFLSPAGDPLGKGYQILQSLIGIGSGGLFGIGFGRSVQKFNYLPESHTDAIFSIIAEEFGFIGSLFIILLFFLFITTGFKIAGECYDSFGKFLAIGLVSGIGFQAFINIAAMCRLLPITGIPLPFISYGASALVTNLVSVGILMNIAKNK